MGDRAEEWRDVLSNAKPWGGVAAPTETGTVFQV
jgi:hypothetical protein